jgi:ATP-dependent DNA helicase RecG
MTNRITFDEIYELDTDQGRVVMFKIPAAPQGIPIAYENHWYGRDNESLVGLNIQELEKIRGQANKEDWSAVTIPDASIDDLDPKAIALAKVNYKDKFKELIAEIDTWDDITFLNKAKITIKGQITRTAIILLGRPESEHFINPAEAKIRWILKDNNSVEKDYTILSCPFIFAVDLIFAKVRNLTYRYIKDGTLFPEEVAMYEPYNIREALNNCIAHQDYKLQGRINVVEFEDKIMFTNLGGFIPGTIEKVINDDAPEENYRNKFLATAMFNLKMVDTIGSGIRKIFNHQRARFFPLPDYEITDRRVQMTLTGKILDLEYARLLARNSDLSLNEIILLDKVQKKKSLTLEEEKSLKNKKLIEGRKPNFHISLSVAKSTGEMGQYIKNKSFNDKYFKDLILEYIKKNGSITKKEIDGLILDKLPAILDNNQKKNKIRNLISSLSLKEKLIDNQGTIRYPIWKLVNQLNDGIEEK